MTDRQEPQPQGAAAPAGARKPYMKPELAWLGSLDELTHGGTPGVADGSGSAGSNGSI